MRHLQLFIVLLIVTSALNSCKETSKSSEAKIESISQEYQAPYFEDTARVNKIKKATAIVDTIFAKYARVNHNPAIAYGIVVDDQLIYSNSVGYSNLEKKIPATSDSRFRIASMTKSFTAMAILKLRDESKLRLTDAAGRDGDARIGAKSLKAGSRPGEGFWFAQPGSWRSFAHAVHVFLTTLSRLGPTAPVQAPTVTGSR